MAIMNRTKRILRGSGISLVIVIAAVMGAMIWWGKKTQTLDFTVPTPKMPTPNAHNTYIAASNAVVNGKIIDYSFASKTVSPTALKQYEQVLAQNKKAFALIHQALKQSYYAPPVRSYLTINTYYAGFRELARLLAFRERVMMQEKRYGEAANAALDCIQMGIQIPHGAALIGDMTGIAIQEIGRYPFWGDIPHLTGAQTDAARNRLEKIIAETYPYDKTIQQEEWKTIASIKQTLPGFNSQKSTVLQPLAQMVAGIALMPYGGPDGVMRNYIRYMNQLGINSRTRYGAHVKPPILPHDPINKMVLLDRTFLSVFSQTGFMDVVNDMTNRLLLTTLALHAYHEDTGHYPASLQSLVPRYLPQVPQDDFAKTGVLKYILKGGQYLLYSVGPDGKDDGGKPIVRVNSYGTKSYSVQQNSIGDMVAGVND